MLASLKSTVSTAILGTPKSQTLSNSKKAEMYKGQMDGFAKNAKHMRFFHRSDLSAPKEGSKPHAELQEHLSNFETAAQKYAEVTGQDADTVKLDYLQHPDNHEFNQVYFLNNAVAKLAAASVGDSVLGVLGSPDGYKSLCAQLFPNAIQPTDVYRLRVVGGVTQAFNTTSDARICTFLGPTSSGAFNATQSADAVLYQPNPGEIVRVSAQNAVFSAVGAVSLFAQKATIACLDVARNSFSTLGTQAQTLAYSNSTAVALYGDHFDYSCGSGGGGDSGDVSSNSGMAPYKIAIIATTSMAVSALGILWCCCRPKKLTTDNFRFNGLVNWFNKLIVTADVHNQHVDHTTILIPGVNKLTEMLELQAKAIAYFNEMKQIYPTPANRTPEQDAAIKLAKTNIDLLAAKVLDMTNKVQGQQAADLV